MNLDQLAKNGIPALPDRHGFAGMFGGVSNDAILCAGGANFSATPMAEGGKRVWHDDVFGFTEGSGWERVGQLPKPRAYGVSGTWRDAVAVVGGNDGQRAAADGWLLRWDGGRLDCEPLPDLPEPATGACGTVVGDDLIVAGGQPVMDGPTAHAACWACDLAAPQRRWRELGWPDGAPGRFLAVAGGDEAWFYVFSGAAIEGMSPPAAPGAAPMPIRRYLTDAWRTRSGLGWERLPDLPRPAAAAPSPSMRNRTGEWVVAGGLWPEYLAEASAQTPFPGFATERLVYSPTARQWCREAPFAASSVGRVVAPVVNFRGTTWILSGETRPGFRTSSVEQL